MSEKTPILVNGKLVGLCRRVKLSQDTSLVKTLGSEYAHYVEEFEPIESEKEFFKEAKPSLPKHITLEQFEKIEAGDIVTIVDYLAVGHRYAVNLFHSLCCTEALAQRCAGKTFAVKERDYYGAVLSDNSLVAYEMIASVKKAFQFEVGTVYAGADGDFIQKQKDGSRIRTCEDGSIYLSSYLTEESDKWTVATNEQANQFKIKVLKYKIDNLKEGEVYFVDACNEWIIKFHCKNKYSIWVKEAYCFNYNWTGERYFKPEILELLFTSSIKALREATPEEVALLEQKAIEHQPMSKKVHRKPSTLVNELDTHIVAGKHYKSRTLSGTDLFYMVSSVDEANEEYFNFGVVYLDNDKFIYDGRPTQIDSQYGASAVPATDEEIRYYNAVVAKRDAWELLQKSKQKENESC